ncbi:MAG: hypothetical protein DRI77_15660 [Chloroflexi bacterium]|nr:MAG: hypothetical protein DRI77_15660 [Chloroflexota bacterium]
MTEAGAVLRAALRDTWDDLFTTAVCNLLWLFFNLVLVTGPPATVALFYYANRLAHGEPTGVGDFLRAVRRYFGVGWRWGLVNGVLLFLLVGDVILTGQLSQSAGARLAQGFFLAGLLAWLLLQLYTLPFLFEQETPSVRLALRNGAAMLGNNLLFSVALGVWLGGILLLGTLLFMLSLAAGSVFLALVGNHAVLNRLNAYGDVKR